MKKKRTNREAEKRQRIREHTHTCLVYQSFDHFLTLRLNAAKICTKISLYCIYKYMNTKQPYIHVPYIYYVYKNYTLHIAHSCSHFALCLLFCCCRRRCFFMFAFVARNTHTSWNGNMPHQKINYISMCMCVCV